jgi:hypothetical protein
VLSLTITKSGLADTKDLALRQELALRGNGQIAVMPTPRWANAVTVVNCPACDIFITEMIVVLI